MWRREHLASRGGSASDPKTMQMWSPATQACGIAEDVGRSHPSTFKRVFAPPRVANRYALTPLMPPGGLHALR